MAGTGTTNTADTALLEWLIADTEHWEQFITWYQTNSDTHHEDGKSVPEESAKKFEALKGELGLTTINYIREKVGWIIAASQQSYPSPSKTPHTSKYDYMSPIKSVKKTQPQKPSNQQTKVQKLVEPSRPKTEPPQMKNANNEKKKRVALFSPTASKQYEGVNLDDLDSSMQKLDFDDSKLAERMNAPSSKMENLGELKMLTSSNRNGKNQNRKSLNSEGNSDKGRKPMNKNHSSGSLNLADFIVEKPKKKKGKKKNKQSLEDRLNPKPNLNDSSSSLNTSCSDLNTSAVSSILDVSNISTALDLESSMESRLDTSASTVQGHNTSMESACSDIDPVRKDIWQDIVKHIEHSKGVQVSEISPRPQNETPTKEVKRFAKADPEKVTMRTSLDNLAKVYTLCLAKGLTPSVLMELFLMAELLVIQQSEKDEKFVNQLFGSLHNCVYFACKVLSSQSHMLQFLDKNTCALICSMERVERFEPELKAKLLSLTVKSGQQEVDMGKKNRSEILESIRFQTEKDNQSNFPNDRVFQDFKKQRDQFYEVLRNWKAKDKKFASDPAKNTAQSRKVASKAQDQFEESVRRLLNIQHHPVNMAHLARLFRDQMLTTCSAEALDRKESDVMDEIRTRADPTKMMSLQKRFGSGLGGVDVSLEQQYLGSERFFKDFIKCSNDSIFLEHLKRALIESIGEKNKEIFTVKDFEDNKLEDGHQSVSRLVQEEVSNTIITLRIAAKFLAFIDAMPYNCDVKALSEAMVLEQINIRSQIRPPLSLQTMLKEALQKKRLILTLPWMVEFCLNLDPIALQLPHYQRLLELMATIYKSVLTETNPVYVLDSLNSFYLKLILGSMFEKTWVPREYFVDNCDEATVLMEKIISQREFHLPNTLDENQVILRDLIHICCPHITDLKAILRQFTSGKKTNVLNSQEMVKNNSEVTKSNAEKSKKVYLRLTSEEEADVADEDKEDDEEASLHKSMEQNFFHNQSIAIKKSVHFVAERLAVKMTAKISNEILVSVLEKLESHVRSSVEAAMDMSDGEVNDVIAAEVKAEVEEIAIGHMTMTKRLAMDLVLKELPGQVEDAILLLLPEGMGEASRRMSVRIAVKQAQVICFNWVKEHVTKTLFLKRGRKMCDSAFGAGKAPKTDRRESVTVENDDIEDVKLPSKAFITMRDTLRKLLANRPLDRELSSKDILDMLLEVATFYQPTKYELAPVMLNAFGPLTVDWIIALTSKKPSLMTSEVQDSFIQFWKSTPGAMVDALQDHLMVILSSRNVLLLSQSPDARSTWTKFEILINKLLKAELILPIILEDNCLALLRREWPTDILNRLASCLRGVTESWKRDQKCAESQDFVELMEWIVWYCQEKDSEFDTAFPAL